MLQYIGGDNSMDKLCPLLKRTVVIHNDLKSDKTAYIGINRFCNNDIIMEEFQICYKKDCMFFSETTGKCLLVYQSRLSYEFSR